MAQTFNVDLDSLSDPMLILARAGGGSDHMSMHKRDGFRIVSLLRLHPRPIAVIDPADPQYPFVSNAAHSATSAPGGGVSLTTPDLKQDTGGIAFGGNIYMLDWDPQSPPPERPGPHFKVFP
jgi:hypothetical protein